MRKFLIIACLFPYLSFGQLITYVPSMEIEKTYSASHYDSDYIYIDNISQNPVNLQFELLEEINVPGWHASVCTGAICYTNIPGIGAIGVINPGEQGYISINLSTNDVLGEGLFRFAILDKDHPEIKDTISFIYHIEDPVMQNNLPWVRINFYQQVLTVILKNPQYDTNLSIYDIKGNKLVHLPVEAITSYRLDNFQNGVYFVVVRDETGRELNQKIVNIRQ